MPLIFLFSFVLHAQPSICQKWFERLDLKETSDCDLRCLTAKIDVATSRCHDQCETLCSAESPARKEPTTILDLSPSSAGGKTKPNALLLPLIVALALPAAAAAKAPTKQEFLVKTTDERALAALKAKFPRAEAVTPDWTLVPVSSKAETKRLLALRGRDGVSIVQRNFEIRSTAEVFLLDPLRRAALTRFLATEPPPPTEDPALPRLPAPRKTAPRNADESAPIIALLDTGADYGREDLLGVLWRNPGEHGTDAEGRDKSANGIDDDGNGLTDDTLGWDFVASDEKPFDRRDGLFGIVNGDLPGHGTRSAVSLALSLKDEAVAAAQNLKIMVLRILDAEGRGKTADVVRAIHYALQNGAKILSNSWISEGDESVPPKDVALAEAMEFARGRGAFFVAIGPETKAADLKSPPPAKP